MQKISKPLLKAGSILLLGAALIGGRILVYGSPCTKTWNTTISETFAAQAIKDVTEAQAVCHVLVLNIQSPGGEVFSTIEIVRAMRKAKEAGLIIETHGGSLVASGATFLLGAGSAGHRYVIANGFHLVHGVQVSRGWGPGACAEYKQIPETDDDKSNNHLIRMLALEYSAMSGKPIKSTLGWLDCDKTQVGFGGMMIKLGLADRVEK